MPTTRRATRSQSRDIAEHPVAGPQLGNSRRATRSQSRQTSVELETSAGGMPKSNTRRNARQHLTTQLGTVQESPNREQESVNDSPKSPAARSDSLVSDHSSTALTSASQAEFEDLDPDIIVACLPDLYNNAASLLRFLLPPNSTPDRLQSTIRQLADPRSKQTRLFEIRDKALAVAQEPFGQRTYLRLDLILRSLLGPDSVDDLSDRPWRPDGLVFNANLAASMTKIVRLSADDVRAYDVLISLDADFPAAFLPGFATPEVETSTLLSDTCDLALELRTQVIIMALLSPGSKGIDPKSIIDKAFLDEDDDEDSSDYSRSTVKGWSGLPPPYEVVVHDEIFTDMVMQRVTDLVDALKAVTDPRELQKVYPWEIFQMRYMIWAEQRMNEINDNIAARGGPSQIVTTLESRRASGGSHEASVAQDLVLSAESGPGSSSGKTAVAPTSTSISFASKSGIAVLKARQHRLANTAFKANAHDFIPNHELAPAPIAASTMANANPSTADDDWLFVDDEASDDPIEEIRKSSPPPSPRKTQLDKIRQRVIDESRENKENRRQRSLLDPQAGAIRVEWREGEESQEGPVGHEGAGLTQHLSRTNETTDQRKRAYGTDVNELSEDEGFQNDTRNVAVPARTVNIPAPARQSLQKHSLPSSAARSASPASSPKRKRRNPGQAINPYQPPPRHESEQSTAPTGYDYNLVSQRAKIMTKVATSEKPARSRQPWQPIEDDRLIYLIGEHGPNYAMIKRVDNDGERILKGRTAEDLRFKARNMKVVMLKDNKYTGNPLPDNFEEVMLAKKELDQLLRLGIQYEQRAVRARPAAESDDE